LFIDWLLNGNAYFCAVGWMGFMVGEKIVKAAVTKKVPDGAHPAAEGGGAGQDE
jgi:hypothetical protein